MKSKKFNFFFQLFDYFSNYSTVVTVDSAASKVDLEVRTDLQIQVQLELEVKHTHKVATNILRLAFKLLNLKSQ